MSNQTNFFCSELSRNAGESLCGTASIGQIWLLLEHPQPWGEKALETSQLPEQVKVYLRGVLKNLAGSRFLLIRQGHSQSESLNFFIAVTRESAPYIRHFKLKSYEDLLRLDIPGLALHLDQRPEQRTEHEANRPATGQPEECDGNSPLYLVCTDGKHDKCCAKYGQRVYQSLKANLGRHVWESSHVGGDRFAANLVCFPHGLFFGRVSETEAEQIVSDYRNGQIYLSKYRGRSCYSHNVQVGEFFIRSQSGNLKLDSLRFMDDEAPEENPCQVRFRSAEDETIQVVKFLQKMSVSEIPTSCHSEDKRRVAQYSLLEYTAFDRSAFLPIDLSVTGQMRA